MPHAGLHARGERGWVGLVGLLVALLILAFLASIMLRQYGPGDSGGTARKSEQALHPGEGPDSGGATDATPSQSRAIERARSVESTLQQGASDQAKRIEEQAR